MTVQSNASVIESESGKNWAMMNGDSCESIKEIPDRSVDLSVYSPPFSNLYIYSDSDRDMGNSANDDEFFTHYRFLLREMLRVTVIGRLSVVHCKDLPKYANRDGTAGLIDFPGKIIAAHEAEGWSYHSRVTIWKCPVTERERTNNNGLLHKTVMRDRSQIRMGMADYLLVFRRAPEGTLMSEKPLAGDGFTEYVGASDPFVNQFHPSPFARTDTRCMNAAGDVMPIDRSIVIWRRYAEPVWWDINQTDVMKSFRDAGDEQDERHICPLQLDLIERAVDLWSDPGELVFSPFAGVGSELIGAIRRKRKALGIELKSSYFKSACGNLKREEKIIREDARQKSMFDEVPA